jgi:hypothetical protein
MIDQLQDLVIDLPVFDLALLRLLNLMLLLSQLLLEDGDLRLLLAVLFVHLMNGQTFITYRVLQCVQTLLHFLVRLLVVGKKLESVLTDRFAGRIHVSKLQIAEAGPLFEVTRVFEFIRTCLYILFGLLRRGVARGRRRLRQRGPLSRLFADRIEQGQPKVRARCWRLLHLCHLHGRCSLLCCLRQG